MRGLGSGHVTCGSMRGLEKRLHGEGTDRQTDQHTNRHRDSMTESAQRADSVKITKAKMNYIATSLDYTMTSLDYTVKLHYDYKTLNLHHNAVALPLYCT